MARNAGLAGWSTLKLAENHKQDDGLFTNEQDLTDEEIIASVNNTEDEPIKKDTGISYTEATKILDKALRYIEALFDGTIADVLLFKKWRKGCIQMNKNQTTKENCFLLC